MNNIVVLVGQNIRMLRLNRGLSQESLALRAGMNPAYMGQIERGEKSATIVSLEKIANALDVNFQELFNFDSKQAELVRSSYIEKISYELRSRTEEEQEYIYDFVRKLLKFRDDK